MWILPVYPTEERSILRTATHEIDRFVGQAGCDIVVMVVLQDKGTVRTLTLGMIIVIVQANLMCLIPNLLQLVIQEEMVLPNMPERYPAWLMDRTRFGTL